jgi:predicted MFS family arabinose efflux permease
MLVVMEFGEPARRPTYLGLANTGTGLAGMTGPMLGALLAGWSYDWLFALSAGVNLAALAVLRWWVREPRWAGEALVNAD